MAISFPISLPTNYNPARIRMIMEDFTAMSISPFSAVQQVYSHQGCFWRAEITLPEMERADAALWAAALASLRGRFGTFLLGDPAADTLLGDAGGSPVVNGAGQTGFTLAISGLTGTLKAGDYIQLGSGSTARLHMVVQDGTTSLEIWPRLRESPANGAAITLASPKGVFRLDTNQRAFSWEAPVIAKGITFSAIEAL